MTPIQHNIRANGIDLALYEYAGTVSAEQPPIIFFHASSFHARCWDAVIALLPGRQCWALDTRNHGRSAITNPHNPWPKIGHDAIDVLRQLELRGAIGVGHSLGGNQLIRAAAAMPHAFSALLLLDPVVFSPDWYRFDEYDPASHFTFQRRNHWRGPDEMFARFQGRGPFANWQPQILRDYCDYGLRPDPNPANVGNFVLACSPEAEANVYTSGRLRVNSDIYAHIAKIQQPVCILRCPQRAQSINELDISPTDPALASRFAHATDIVLPAHYSHFIPMEDPALVAEKITHYKFVRHNS